MSAGTLERLSLMFWRLIPANPILTRVVHGASKRVRHLWIRFGYLFFLFMVVLIAMVGSPGGSAGATLADHAKNASTMFKWASITQLALMCFLAPVFTAGAITQERDAQTFNILIATPLSNAQIVLGSLMSRLYFVCMLLLGGLPIFLMMMIYGGVTFAQIVQSFAIAGATAVVTGSLAICISMIRVGTRRTILSFYVMIGLYLLALYALGNWDRTWIDEAVPNIQGQRLSWLAPFHPFLALDVALNRMPAPDMGVLGGRNAVARYFLAYPHRAYLVITLAVSLILIVLAMFFVRQPKEGEVSFFAALTARITHRDVEERRRKPRSVWSNPVAWREATSRASAATRGVLNVALLGGGVVTAIVLLINHVQTQDVAFTRTWLSGVVMIELALILLAATNTAATSMTKDKESKTMDLLLATPLTSQYLVWGKLRGLVTFTVPLVLIPTVTVLMLGVHGLFDGAAAAVPIEAAFEVAVLMTAYSAAACLLGLHVSLHSMKTVRAVMTSVGVVVVACLLATLIANSIVEGKGVWGAVVAPLTPFTGVRSITNPAFLFDTPQSLAAGLPDARLAFLVSGTITVLVYVAIVTTVYRSMVRGFDMVIRKQSGQM